MDAICQIPGNLTVAAFPNIAQVARRGRVPVFAFQSSQSTTAVLTIARDYYVSFAGNVTFPRAEELREAARHVPPDRLLAETDSPYLSPQPRRGRPNEPANVVHTVAALAEARGEEPEALAQRLDANAAAAFGLT